MKSSYNGVPVPSNGKVIEYSGGKFLVPDQPVIPFIEGDGTGRDIWKASRRVFDAAVEKAYGGKKKIAWLEIFAGECATMHSVCSHSFIISPQTNEKPKCRPRRQALRTLLPTDNGPAG